MWSRWLTAPILTDSAPRSEACAVAGEVRRADANMCSCLDRRPRSCTPTWTRSMPRSSSATTPACAVARSSSGRGWCSRPATRPRPTAFGRRWAARTLGGCARRRWSCRRGCRRTPRRARPCSTCSPRRRRWSRGSRSTRRSSTFAAWSGSPGSPTRDRRAAAARGPRARRPADHGRGRHHQVPGQGGQRGREARRPAPRAARAASSAFLHPLPVERLWGVGPRQRSEAARKGLVTVGEVAQLAEPALVSMLGRPPGAISTPSPTTATPRRVRGRRRRRSMGSQRALGRAARSPERPGRRRSSGSSTASPAGCAQRGGSAARSLFGCASATSLARPGPDTLPEATAQTQPILATARKLLADGHADDRAAGHHAPRRGARQPLRRRRDPARAAARSGAARRPRRRPRRHPRPVRVGRHRAGGADRPRSGRLSRCSPTRSTQPTNRAPASSPAGGRATRGRRSGRSRRA